MTPQNAARRAMLLTMGFDLIVAAISMVLANFLMSPEAQAHAQDPDVLG